MNLFKRSVVALFVVFLHYSGQITVRSVEDNRYMDDWQHLDAVAILLGIVLIASVAVALDLLVRRFGSPWMRRVFNHLFLAALASGLMAASPRLALAYPNVIQILWLPVMLLIGFSLAREGSVAVKYAANFCLVFSPVVIILAVQMFTWSTWHQRRERLPEPQAGGKSGGPVLVFVFDEWSPQRSMQDGEFLPWMKNLRSLCGQSVGFSRAVSPYPSTELSLPRFIYQTDQEFVVRRGACYWGRGPTAVNTTDRSSLFRLGREADYATHILGFHLPYRHILGDQVDYCRTFPTDPLKDGLLAKIVLRFCENMYYWNDPISRRLRREVTGVVDRKRRRRIYKDFQEYREEMFQIFDDAPRRSFAVFHVRLPHFPLIFREDGSYCDQPARDNSFPAYERQLRYLDVVIGQIVDALRANGRFDEATILITSDHSWRPDPLLVESKDPAWQSAIPLVIKLPGQTAPARIDRPICTNQLEPLFEALFNGRRDPDELLGLLEELAEQDD